MKNSANEISRDGKLKKDIKSGRKHLGKYNTELPMQNVSDRRKTQLMFVGKMRKDEAFLLLT